MGLINEGEGVAAQVLISLGIPLEDARRHVEEIIGAGQVAPSGHIPFTPRAKKVLELSLREALQLGHNYIGTEHVLLGLVREGKGVAAQVLVTAGADLETVRRRVVEIVTSRVSEAVSGESFQGPSPTEEVVFRGMSERSVAGQFKEPVCPRCRSSLERTARTKTFEVPASEGEPRPVTFVFCSACGETLLASDST